MVCGNIRSIRGNDLIYGISKACSKECTDTLVGQRFGRWTVLSVDKSKKGRTFYICKCDCGTIKSVCRSILKNGQSKSCGCLRKKVTSERMCKLNTYEICGDMTKVFDDFGSCLLRSHCKRTGKR